MWREATESEKSKVLSHGQRYGKRRYHINLFILVIATLIAVIAFPSIKYSKEARAAYVSVTGFEKGTNSEELTKRMVDQRMQAIPQSDTKWSSTYYDVQRQVEEDLIKIKSEGNKAASAVYKKAYIPEAIILGIAVLIGLLLGYINDAKLRLIKNDKFKVMDIVIRDKCIRQRRREVPMYLVYVEGESDAYWVPHEIYDNCSAGKQALLLNIEGYGCWNDSYDIVP